MAEPVQPTFHRYQPGSAEAPEALDGINFLSANEIEVTHQPVSGAAITLVRGVHYTITLPTDSSDGTITAIGTWPAGDVFHAQRVTSIEQPSQYDPHRIPPGRSIEADLDRLTRIAQEAQADRSRAVKVAMGAIAPLLAGIAGAAVGDPLEVTGPNEIGAVPFAESQIGAVLEQVLAAALEAVSARDVAVAAASDPNAISFPRFSTVATLLADTLITTGVTGRTWLGGGVSFTEAASGATDHHVTTAGGIKLYVVPSYGYAKPIYEAAAFGITPALSGTTLADKVTGALAKLPEFTALRLGAGEYVLNRVTVGTVLPGSAGTFGAIYLDKQGQELIGVGKATHLNGNDLGLHPVMCRASHTRVRKMLIGNVKGELNTAEAAGVCIEPSNYPRINPMGADIEDIQVDDCDFYLCENFISAHPEAWGTLSEALTNATTTERFTAFYKAKKIKVTNCRGVNAYRTAVELFQADDSEVTGCFFTKGNESGATGQTIAPVVRGIGARRVKVTGNTFINNGTLTDGERAVEMSLSGFYSLSPQSTISADFVISGNHFFNFVNCIGILESQGFANIFGNNAYLPDGIAEARFVNITSTGVNPFDLRLKNKAGVVKVHGNNVVGGTHLVKTTGSVDELEIIDNTYIGGDVAAAYLLEAAMQSNANPAIAALERIPITVIKGNTCITKAGTSPPILLTQMKADDLVYLEGNRIVPSTAGRIIGNAVGTNSGTVIIPSLTSNERLPATEWAARYDPMASTLAERRLVA